MEMRTPEEILRDAGGTSERHQPPPTLAEYLSAETWLDRDFLEPERFLGELIVAGVRMFIVGRTGLGKTLLGMAMAVAMAGGTGFLHWAAGRPCRVLYLDGEMPGALIRQRLRDALRRAGNPNLAGRLIIFGHDIEDEIAKLFPKLGAMPPLNSEAGRNWLLALIDALGDVDVICLDNVMSLLDGLQKEEESWTGATPLVDALSRRGIAQVWLDHTGHDGGRQYGTSTKSWRFDAVALMTALIEELRQPGEVAFGLSFDPPGKCRRRTPANWRDFESCTVRLADDRWTSEPAGTAKAGPKIKPSRMPFYHALISAITRSAIGPGKTAIDTWQNECLRRGLIERPPKDGAETPRERGARFAAYRAAKSDLIAAAWIAIDDDAVTDLHGRWG